MKLTKYYKNQLFYAFLVKYNVQASADKVLAMWGLVRVCAKFHLQKEYALTKLLAVKSSYFFKAFLLRVILESGHSSMLIRWKVMRKTWFSLMFLRFWWEQKLQFKWVLIFLIWKQYKILDHCKSTYLFLIAAFTKRSRTF